MNPADEQECCSTDNSNKEQAPCENSKECSILDVNLIAQTGHQNFKDNVSTRAIDLDVYWLKLQSFNYRLSDQLEGSSFNDQRFLIGPPIRLHKAYSTYLL